MNNKYLLRMDFKSFFESISYKDVYAFCQNSLKGKYFNWSDRDSEIFSKFVCYKGNLVMGAVTSPALTNAMCFDLDKNLHEACEKNQVTYTRYADDLYFSTNKPNILKTIEKETFSIVRNLACPSNLEINTSKTFHSSRKRKMVITGLVITNDGEISIGRDKKREIRSFIYNWDKIEDNVKPYTSGYLSYINSVEPDFVNKLCLKYGAEKIRTVIQFVQHSINK